MLGFTARCCACRRSLRCRALRHSVPLSCTTAHRAGRQRRLAPDSPGFVLCFTPTLHHDSLCWAATADNGAELRLLLPRRTAPCCEMLGRESPAVSAAPCSSGAARDPGAARHLPCAAPELARGCDPRLDRWPLSCTRGQPRLGLTGSTARPGWTYW